MPDARSGTCDRTGVIVTKGAQVYPARTPVVENTLVRLPSFIAKRFDTKSSLGLSLTIGLVLAAAATWLFAALLDAVFDRATMVRWDVATATRVHSMVTPAGTRIFDWITRVGSPNSMTWMTIVVCLLLLGSRRVNLAIVWIAAFGGGAALEHILKTLVHRTRPEYAGHYLASGSYSFPSGHATLSFLAVALLLYTLIVTHRMNARPARVVCVGLGAIWVLLVGFSRIYLGVHFPSDILGGYTVAAAWFSVCVTVTNLVSRGRRGPATETSS